MYLSLFPLSLCWDSQSAIKYIGPCIDIFSAGCVRFFVIGLLDLFEYGYQGLMVCYYVYIPTKTIMMKFFMAMQYTHCLSFIYYCICILHWSGLCLQMLLVKEWCCLECCPLGMMYHLWSVVVQQLVPIPDVSVSR